MAEFVAGFTVDRTKNGVINQHMIGGAPSCRELLKIAIGYPKTCIFKKTTDDLHDLSKKKQ